MKKSAPHPLRAFWLRIVVCLVVGLGTMEGGVLCVGAEGHVALEHAQNRCCDDLDEAGGAPSAPSLQASPDDDCGPCVDLPLSRSSLERSSSSAQNLQSPRCMAAFLPSPLFRTPSPARFRTSDGEAHVGNARLFSLRSVVLLI